ncbi:Contactin-4 [Folsomia candida]|uniref:Contactin-4 n=1 Tax=Folsomia candida TaxID=158441 RepID=A0A226DP07_FOLCA|nr:Contactin-4 [Folsomia candida]
MNRLTFTTLLINFALGLKLENVTVPKYGSLHGWVKLYCDFVMDADEPLLVLKWYKDGHEFFRYSPNIQPNILDFPTAGVHVNVSQSGLNHVMLRNISLQSGGSYKCEVSADRPSFRTLQGTGDMIVIAPPAADPEITGIHPAVSVGETINANCTSFHSQPAASLMRRLARFANSSQFLSPTGWRRPSWGCTSSWNLATLNMAVWS